METMSSSEDFAVALKIAKIVFEPSNFEHHAILRKAHHLCKIGGGSWLEVVTAKRCGNCRSGHRIFLSDEAVRL
jgi:hypothetical protein